MTHKNDLIREIKELEKSKIGEQSDTETIIIMALERYRDDLEEMS